MDSVAFIDGYIDIMKSLGDGCLCEAANSCRQDHANGEGE